MSLRRVRGLLRRIAGTDRFDALDRRLDELFEICAIQNHLVHETHSLLTRGAVDTLDESLRSIGVAHAESMVYLNRAVAQLRANVESDRRALDPAVEVPKSK
jgi:hypothetical protein